MKKKFKFLVDFLYPKVHAYMLTAPSGTYSVRSESPATIIRRDCSEKNKRILRKGECGNRTYGPEDYIDSYRSELQIR